MMLVKSSTASAFTLGALILASSLHVFKADKGSCAENEDPNHNSPAQESCSNSSNKNYELFEQILAQDYDAIDETLPDSISEIKNRGGHRCWHKHSTFLEHLIGVNNILRLWGETKVVGRVGLFHSAYSNSYVNLALFSPDDENERKQMREMIGVEAEELVYLFCVIDRQKVVVDTLLAQGFIPKDGLDVPHLRDDGQIIHLSPETLRMLVVFTMADIADQYFGWQDQLFGGEEQTNSMLIPGDDVSQHDSTALWPGISKPGLWMNYVSQLGSVARTFTDDDDDDDDINFRQQIPPVFDDCTLTLTRTDEALARDLYWSVVTGSISSTEDVVETIKKAIEYNPWSFEPHVMLAQKYLHLNDNENAQKEASRALELQMMWGSAYDKRLSFPAWVAWTRVLHQRAADQLGWPTNSWDVNNFGWVE